MKDILKISKKHQKRTQNLYDWRPVPGDIVIRRPNNKELLKSSICYMRMRIGLWKWLTGDP